MKDSFSNFGLGKSRVPFAEHKRSEEFGRALIKKMMKRVAELRKDIISPQNVCNLPHGHGWTFQQQRTGGFFPESSECKSHLTEFRLDKKRILSNDFSLVNELIFNIADGMHEEFMKSLLNEMDVTCSRFGRVTNISKNGSLADGILESLAGIHASVDKNGHVSFPQMILSPDLLERLKSELLTRGDEVERKATEIRAKAENEAREREAERLAKFDRL